MSCDHELAKEWACCSGKNASYITIAFNTMVIVYKVNQTYFEEVVNSKVDWHTELSDLTSWKGAQKKRNNTVNNYVIILYYLMLT